ncbi:hypothetical protein [Streptomyces sp. NPDC052107]|uniref:hypothetical protein n=1 Tax=Streptomyces sp. NPDC052107 TaxID=3155632 RepID=UPI0034283FBE
MPVRAEPPPLLFLDVDGTVLPYDGARLPSTPEGWDDWQSVSNPQLAKIGPGHGPRLLALPCVLMWATAWKDNANQVIAPLLGLPHLPVADLPEVPAELQAGALNWKTQALVHAAAGLPVIWIDDSITDTDRTWVSAQHQGQALLHRVDSTTGLISTDFVAVQDWTRLNL